MDVRCPSCGTDYELDNARVPDTGLPVKCSRCAHVFRAVRPPPGAPEAPKVVTGVHAAASEWMIRKANGETVRFRELTTLQRWIVERKVTRTDEISKTGKKWEKLGNIPELNIFFQVIESREETNPGSQLPPSALSDAVAELQAAQTNPAIAALQQPAERPRVRDWPIDRPWSPNKGKKGKMPPPHLTPPPPPLATDAGRPAAPPRTGPDPFTETLPDPTEKQPQLKRPAPPPPPTQITPKLDPAEQRHETVRWDLSPDLPEDVRQEYEIGGGRPGKSELATRRIRARHIVGIAVTLVAAVMAVSYVLRPAWFAATLRHYVAGVPPEAVRSVDEAYTALMVDTGASIDTAVAQLEAAVGLDGSYAAARAALAEALAARADLNRDLADFRGAALAAQPVLDPAPELATVAQLRAKADRDISSARLAAQQALDVDPASVAGRRAMLEVARMSGEPERATEIASSIRAQLPDDVRLTLATASMALVNSAVAESAQKDLGALLVREPRANHARYLIARLLAARGKKDEAGTALGELLATTPSHERALALQKSLTAPAAAQQPQVGSATADPKTTTPTNTETPPAANPSPTAQTAPAPSATPTAAGTPTPTPDAAPATPTAPSGPKSVDDPTLTFAEALARGERLRAQDRTSQAVRFYERAAVLEPNDADAFLGVGYCRLDLGELTAAVTAFRRAIELSPRFPDAHFGLAEAYRIRGNKLFAIRSYKAYLDIAPQGPDSEVARNHLQELQDDNSAAPPPQTPAPAPDAPAPDAPDAPAPPQPKPPPPPESQ